MITLYGNQFSGPSNKVRFLLHALELEYHYHSVNMMAGEHRSPTHLRLHPAGKVPVLVDGDFILFESNAMLRYLADKNASSFYPKELKVRALVEQWLDFSSLHIATALNKVFINRVAYSVMGLQKDERALQEGLGLLDRFLPVIEAQLQKNKFLPGPDMSLADFSLLSALDPAEAASIDLSLYPHLKRWQESLQAMPFYQKCYPSYALMLKSISSQKN